MRKLWISLLFVLLTMIPFTHGQEITPEAANGFQKIAGLEFSSKEIEPILETITGNLQRFAQVRALRLPNSVPPALQFNPIPIGFKATNNKGPSSWSPATHKKRPLHISDLAFYNIRDLAELIRTKEISSEELTRFYIERLKRHDKTLRCVITYTEHLALKQARRADKEIAAGQYRGLLHGIPYGVKDLLSTKGIRTTWGSAAFTNQVFNVDATVVSRLEKAGAILIAKLTTGELAWDDIWYGGQTRNPWNPQQGSSGSSAGPASATAAGLVPFAIGSETWGSIVSPSTRCGTTGLRPTYGRVSRYGAMALSWSMDKIGPICRDVEDCAIVFDAIQGPDGLDQSLRDSSFSFSPTRDLSSLRIGYLKSEIDKSKHHPNDKRTVETLRKMGIELIPIELPDHPTRALSIILTVESGAVFTELTRGKDAELLQRPSQADWFRAAHFVPAVEYIQANRARYLLIQEMHKIFQQVDIIVAPARYGNSSLVSNLTGHPCVVVPNGTNEKQTPTSITFLGNLDDDATLLEFAKRYQDATTFHLKTPPKYQF